MKKKRLVTGVTPSGSLTIGNYFGMLKHLKGYLDSGYELFVFVADAHALSIPQNVSALQLRKNTIELLLVLNALGINNTAKNCNVFIQSQHLNLRLGFISQFFTSIGELERMTQFKSKKEGVKGKNKTTTIPTGLLTYPTLMAADILLYLPDFVPVGEDQKQHLELTKTIASRLNTRAGSKILKIPDFIAPKVGGKIKSLFEPTKKMSKSDTNKSASILLLDTEDSTINKIKKAKTDSIQKIEDNFEIEQVGVSNLLDLYYLCNKSDQKQLFKFISDVNNSDVPYKFLKESVGASLNKELRKIRQSIEKEIGDKVAPNSIEEAINKDPNWLPSFMTSNVWKHKQEYIDSIASETLNKLMNKLGFVY